MSHHHKAKPKTLTNALIATHFAVHPRTVAAWTSKGCPKTSYRAVAKWCAENLRTERRPLNKRIGGAPGQSDEMTLAEKRTMADTRKIEADVALRELRLAEKVGDLVSHKETERELAEWAIRIKERLLAAPAEFYTRWPAAVRDQCHADFQEFIRQLLLEISRWKVLGTSMDNHIVAAGLRITANRSRLAEHER